MNMYSKLFHYQCEKIIPEYYDDKEDAHLMYVKGLRHRYSNKAPSSTMEESPSSTDRRELLSSQ